MASRLLGLTVLEDSVNWNASLRILSYRCHAGLILELLFLNSSMACSFRCETLIESVLQKHSLTKSAVAHACRRPIASPHCSGHRETIGGHSIGNSRRCDAVRRDQSLRAKDSSAVDAPRRRRRIPPIGSLFSLVGRSVLSDPRGVR